MDYTYQVSNIYAKFITAILQNDDIHTYTSQCRHTLTLIILNQNPLSYDLYKLALQSCIILNCSTMKIGSKIA